MTYPHDLVSRALARFRGATQDALLVRQLVEALEATRRAAFAAGDEAALRGAIDGLFTVELLAWADLREERGEQAVAAGLRLLARAGRWPGRAGGRWHWRPENPQYGGGASWTLPAEVVQALPKNFDSPSAALLAAAPLIAAQYAAMLPTLRTWGEASLGR
jgi:hypothetical protein